MYGVALSEVAGYSSTPVAKKLGIGINSRLTVIGAPEGLAETLSEPGEGSGTSEVTVIFATRAHELAQTFHQEVNRLAPDGAIWCAWPKKASGIATDISENLLREMFLPTGMVDNKVAALDATWSGLRFVVRKELRTGWPGSIGATPPARNSARPPVAG